MAGRNRTEQHNGHGRDTGHYALILHPHLRDHGPGARFAILNGKVMQEGQQFGLQMGNQIYQVTVQAIADGQVVLAYEGGQVVVPLRRK